MTCYAGETIDVAREVDWHPLESLLASRVDESPIEQVAREINARQGQMNVTKTVWDIIGVDPADEALADFEWAGSGKNVIGHVSDLLLDMKLDLALMLSSVGIVDENAIRWRVTGRVATLAALNSATGALDVEKREDWCEWIEALRTALDAMEEIVSDAWTPITLYVKIFHVENEAFGFYNGLGNIEQNESDIYYFDTTVTDTTESISLGGINSLEVFECDDSSFDYDGLAPIAESAVVESLTESPLVTAGVGDGAFEVGVKLASDIVGGDPELINTNSPAFEAEGFGDVLGWYGILSRNVTWAAGLYTSASGGDGDNLVPASSLPDDFELAVEFTFDTENEINCTSGVTPGSKTITFTKENVREEFNVSYSISYTGTKMRMHAFYGDVTFPFTSREFLGWVDTGLASADVKETEIDIPTADYCFDALGILHGAT